MPEDDDISTWKPRRGRLFQMVAWGLVGLFVAGVVAGIYSLIGG